MPLFAASSPSLAARSFRKHLPFFGKYKPLPLAHADGLLGVLFGVATEFVPCNLLYRAAIQQP
jgi:hypothetical protein